MDIPDVLTYSFLSWPSYSVITNASSPFNLRFYSVHLNAVSASLE